jgi:uncharacterized protein
MYRDFGKGSLAVNFLYECEVSHSRKLPKAHHFSHGVFMLDLELATIPQIAKRIPWLSHNRFNLFSINDSDHVRGGEQGGIRENLLLWLDQKGIDCPSDCKIRLITFPRVLGYCFNPVSFYFIETVASTPLFAIVEVTNTFREMKLYPLQHLRSDDYWYRRVAKNFYVSPFSDPGHDFDFTIGSPGENWVVKIDVYDGSNCQVQSTIQGKRYDFTAKRLLYYAIKYPLLSIKIITLIHWHAFRLWLKKIPFFRKAERSEYQIDLMSPPARSKNKSR